MSEFDPYDEIEKFKDKFRERITKWMSKYPDTEPLPIGVNPDGSLYWDRRKERDVETKMYLKLQEEASNEE